MPHKERSMKAIWNNTVVAESDKTILIEGNHYFPASALKPEYFTQSATNTTCYWKGIASYYTLSVNGAVNPDAAWFYPETKALAESIKGHIAFWHGVQIVE